MRNYSIEMFFFAHCPSPNEHTNAHIRTLINISHKIKNKFSSLVVYSFQIIHSMKVRGRSIFLLSCLCLIFTILQIGFFCLTILLSFLLTLQQAFYPFPSNLLYWNYCDFLNIFCLCKEIDPCKRIFLSTIEKKRKLFTLYLN